MKLVLGADYPQAPPKGFFLTKIYHPNVSSNGDICVNTLKKDWNEKVTLCHILAVIRCLLIVPFPESSLNDEAGKVRHCATHMYIPSFFASCFFFFIADQCIHIHTYSCSWIHTRTMQIVPSS
jgi:ubiquitin-protein ligase